MAARPEFMQSKMVGGIVAEALDQQARVAATEAVSTVLTDAAAALRFVHGIPAPADTHVNVHPLTPQGSDPMGYGEEAHG